MVSNSTAVEIGWIWNLSFALNKKKKTLDNTSLIRWGEGLWREGGTQIWFGRVCTAKAFKPKPVSKVFSAEKGTHFYISIFHENIG